MSEILELLSLDLGVLGTKAKKGTQLTANFTVYQSLVPQCLRARHCTHLSVVFFIWVS